MSLIGLKLWCGKGCHSYMEALGEHLLFGLCQFFKVSSSMNPHINHFEIFYLLPLLRNLTITSVQADDPGYPPPQFIYLFTILFIYFYLFKNFFSTVQHGDQVPHTYIHNFSSHCHVAV